MQTKSFRTSADTFSSSPVPQNYFNLVAAKTDTDEYAQQIQTEDSNVTSTNRKVYKILQYLITVVYTLVGLFLWIKDIPVYLFSFESGIPVSFLYTINAIAVLFALIQLLPITSFAGQLGLSLIMIAAFALHLILSNSLLILLLTLLLLILVLVTISLNYMLAEPGMPACKDY